MGPSSSEERLFGCKRSRAWLQRGAQSQAVGQRALAHCPRSHLLSSRSSSRLATGSSSPRDASLLLSCSSLLASHCRLPISQAGMQTVRTVVFMPLSAQRPAAAKLEGQAKPRRDAAGGGVSTALTEDRPTRWAACETRSVPPWSRLHSRSALPVSRVYLARRHRHIHGTTMLLGASSAGQVVVTPRVARLRLAPRRAAACSGDVEGGAARPRVPSPLFRGMCSRGVAARAAWSAHAQPSGWQNSLARAAEAPASLLRAAALGAATCAACAALLLAPPPLSLAASAPALDAPASSVSTTITDAEARARSLPAPPRALSYPWLTALSTLSSSTRRGAW